MAVELTAQDQSQRQRLFHCYSSPFYRCYSPTPVKLGELVRVAGRRSMASRVQRRQASQRRKLVLIEPGQALAGLKALAHALLAVIAATERAEYPA
jgi:hypothetical protein